MIRYSHIFQYYLKPVGIRLSCALRKMFFRKKLFSKIRSTCHFSHIWDDKMCVSRMMVMLCFISQKHYTPKLRCKHTSPNYANGNPTFPCKSNHTFDTVPQNIYHYVVLFLIPTGKEFIKIHASY